MKTDLAKYLMKRLRAERISEDPSDAVMLRYQRKTAKPATTACSFKPPLFRNVFSWQPSTSTPNASPLAIFSAEPHPHNKQVAPMQCKKNAIHDPAIKPFLARRAQPFPHACCLLRLPIWAEKPVLMAVTLRRLPQELHVTK